MTMRVYELAHELNMDKERLLAEIKKLDIQVLNSASLLEDEEVELVRKALSGKTETEEITEKRIRPNIIRRRAKRTPPPPEAPQEPPAQKEEAPAAKVSPAETATAAEHAATREPPAGKTPALEAPHKAVEAPHETTAPEQPEMVQQPEAEPPSAEETDLAEEREKQPAAIAPVGKAEETEGVERAARPAPPPKPRKKRKKKKMEPARILGFIDLKKEGIPVEPERTEEVAQLEPKPAKKRPDKFEVGEELEGKEVGKSKSFKKRKEIIKTRDFYHERWPSLHIPKKEAKKVAKKTEQKAEVTHITPKAIKRKIRIHETITVSELAKAMSVKASEVIKKLMELGVMATINDSLDADVATLVADDFGYEIEQTSIQLEDVIEVHEDKEEELLPRPPVVTVMGHVDHGKTSLLDAIRKTRVAEQEAGGITQHIGSYSVSVDGKKVVFIDTPGHEAFTAMRARGAEVTDIVVLVVAADDGVMAQTIEAINHARAANVPIVVAINKIDKDNANPERVKSDLSKYGLTPEEWGGDTLYAEVSAKMGIGIDKLLENILLQAELLELKANPNKPARGFVIESRMDKGKGPVATVIIKEGTLRQGDPFITGTQLARVRAMMDENGKIVTEAPPSTAVEVQGLHEVPEAGQELIVIKDEKKAKQIIEERQLRQREAELAKESKVTLENLYKQMGKDETKELKLIVKADTQGTIEAVTNSLEKLSAEKVRINIIHSGVGKVTESDVMLASASGAVIISFQLKPDQKTLHTASEEKVQILTFDVIYDLVDMIQKLMKGMIAPVTKEIHIGTAEVREIFNVPRVGTVAGCYVTEGKAVRGAIAHLMRNGEEVYRGKVASLKRFKDDVKEVQSGYECGIGLENFNDIHKGDRIEFYEQVEETPELI